MEENQYHHVANPDKTKTFEENCVDNRIETTYCFCGVEIGTFEMENTALGHAHTIFVGLIYESFLNDGYYGYDCERCDDVNKDQKAPALFECLGFSASSTGDGISLGFKVNNEAVANYTSVTGKAVKYGVFAVSQNKLGDNDIFDENGEATEGVINAPIGRTDFTAFDIKVVGFTDGNKNSPIALGAYVALTENGKTTYSYMQEGTPNEGEKYHFVSFSQIIG